MSGDRGRRSLEPNNTIGKIVDPFQNISFSAFPKNLTFITTDEKTVTLMPENTNFMKAESLELAWSFKR
jgi:hypothetical protein